MARTSAALATLGLLASAPVALTYAPSAAAAGDTAAPTVTRYRVLPASADVTFADRSATVVVRIADTDGAGHNGTGFDHGSLTLSNGTALPVIPLDPSTPVSGSGTDGTYDLTVALPQGTPAGAYTASLSLTDSAGLPGVSGQKVYLQRHSGSRWVAVTTTRTRAGGRYALAVRPRSRGRFAYRIVTVNDAAFLTTASSYRTVTVR